MLIPLHNLQKKFKLHIGGFLHVGAHLAEELDAYRPYNCPIYWIEGIEEKYTVILPRFQGHFAKLLFVPQTLRG
jgi:hypothetical protein